jgi:hypothetical protein
LDGRVWNTSAWLGRIGIDPSLAEGCCWRSIEHESLTMVGGVQLLLCLGPGISPVAQPLEGSGPECATEAAVEEGKMSDFGAVEVVGL